MCTYMNIVVNLNPQDGGLRHFLKLSRIQCMQLVYQCQTMKTNYCLCCLIHKSRHVYNIGINLKLCFLSSWNNKIQSRYITYTHFYSSISSLSNVHIIIIILLLLLYLASIVQVTTTLFQELAYVGVFYTQKELKQMYIICLLFRHDYINIHAFNLYLHINN